MSGEEKEKIKILQVANISSAATRDHVYNMFNYIGKIQEMKVYPSEGNISYNTSLKTAFIKFDDERCAEVGQHLTNTVLIDRAIVCLPYPNPVIPDEESFFNSGGSTTAGQRQLPPHVVNKIQETEDGSAVLITVDPTLEQLGLPAYPSLPADSDPAKVEEIRRTVYVGNLPKGVDGQEVLDLFNMYFGEVMYVRLASGPPALPCAYAYVEFSQQASVSSALQNDGFEFKERPLKIQHSRVAIIKPQAKTDEQALGEIEEAIRLGKSADERGDRRRSRSPRRRRSPSPRRRRDSRDRDRDRDRRRSRDRDRDRKRSRSRDRDRDRKRRSRSRDKDRDTKKRSRSRDRDRDRRRRSKSRDRKRDRSRSKSRDRKREKKRSRSRSTEKKRDKEDRKTERKEEKKENEHESTLREKLLEKKAARKDSSDDEWEEKQQPDGDVKMEENGNGDSHGVKTEVN